MNNKERLFTYFFGVLFGVIAISSTSLIYGLNRTEMFSMLIISIITIIIITIVYLFHIPSEASK